MTVGFDLESRSRVDLKKAGTFRYIEDPSTELLGFAYAFDGDPVVWTPGDPEPTDLLDHIENRGEFSGWNIGGFDCPFWNHIIAPKYNWPKIRLGQQIDTMAQAAMMNLPQSLEVCARELGMPLDQQKNKRGKYLIDRLCKPKIRRKGGLPIEEYFVEDPDLMHEFLYEYLPQDVVTERALAKKLKPLPPLERRFWIVTQRINQRGVPVDIGEVRAIKRVVNKEKRKLNKRAVRIAGNAFAEMSQLDKVKAWIRTQGVPVGSMDKEHVAELLERDLPKSVRKVVEIHEAINQISIAKYDTMLRRVCADGTLKGEIIYHGASTGRDASRGLNAQNIARPPRSFGKLALIESAHEVLGSGDWEWANLNYGDDAMDAAVACVRGVLKAPDGYRWLDVDYSSIENRVGSWIAGHSAKLRMFREGLDEYKTFYSSQFGIDYDDVTKDQRQFAKPIILGGIFGQGWKGMIDYAKKYGVTLSEEEAKKAVDLFREEYKPIQRLWYRCGDASIEAVENPGRAVRAGSRLVFKSDNRFLKLRLPSGRLLRWYKPRVEEQRTPWGEMRPVVTAMGVNTFTRKWQRSKIIGSSFFQSSVQATAADIMRHGCLALEDAGYRLRMRIHDEFLALMPHGEGSVDEMVSTIKQTPEWADGLPIDGEGWEGPRYRKE